MNCVSSGVCHRLSCTATSGFPLYEQLLKAPSWPNRDKAESCVVAEATNRRSFCGVSGLWVLGYLDVSSSCLLQQRNRRLIAKNIGNSAGITLLSSVDEARYFVSSYPAEISPGKTIICGLIEDRSVSVIPVYPGPPAGFGFPACQQNVRFFFITCHQLSLYCWLIAQVYVTVPQFKLIVIAVVQSCDKVSSVAPRCSDISGCMNSPECPHLAISPPLTSSQSAEMERVTQMISVLPVCVWQRGRLV